MRVFGCGRAWPEIICGKATPRGFEPLRAEPNGFLVHHLSHSVTVSVDIALGDRSPCCWVVALLLGTTTTRRAGIHHVGRFATISLQIKPATLPSVTGQKLGTRAEALRIFANHAMAEGSGW